jgi:hypothetical protein
LVEQLTLNQRVTGSSPVSPISMWNIFEHPWTLLLCAMAVQFVMMVIHTFWPQSRKWQHFIPAAALVVAAFAVDYFVVTDREKVQSCIENGLLAARQQNITALSNLIATDYEDSVHHSKDTVMEFCRAWLTRPLIERDKINELTVKVDGPDASVLLFVTLHIDKSSDVYGTVKIALLRMNITLHKYGSNWLVNRAELLEINNERMNWGQL